MTKSRNCNSSFAARYINNFICAFNWTRQERINILILILVRFTIAFFLFLLKYTRVLTIKSRVNKLFNCCWQFELAVMKSHSISSVLIVITGISYGSWYLSCILISSPSTMELKKHVIKLGTSIHNSIISVFIKGDLAAKIIIFFFFFANRLGFERSKVCPLSPTDNNEID